MCEVDLEGPFPIEVGDTFVLCSDGLSGQVKDDELGAIVSALAPDEAVQMLVDLANLRGGPDNITVIVAKATDERLATQTDRPWLVKDDPTHQVAGISAWVWGALLVFAGGHAGAWRPWVFTCRRQPRPRRR